MREGGGRLFLSIESRLRLQCFRERNTQKSLFYDFIKYLKILLLGTTVRNLVSFSPWILDYMCFPSRIMKDRRKIILLP